MLLHTHREIKPDPWPVSLPDLAPEMQALWRDCVLALPFWNVGQNIVEDMGPQRLHGAIGSTISLTSDWVGSPYGAALVWNGGTNDKITIADPPSDYLDGTTQLSIEMLFKPTTLGGAGQNYGLLNKYIANTGQRSWRFQLDGDEFSLQVSDNGSGNEEQKTTNANLVTGTWYHVVATYNAGIFRCYLNGVQLTTDGDFSTELSIWNSPTEFRVGQRVTAAGNPDTIFNGHIAKITIWNPRVLSADEARLLWENKWGMYDHGLWLPSLAVEHSGGAAAGPWISAGKVAKGLQQVYIPGLMNGTSYDVKSETLDLVGNRSAGSTPVTATPAAGASAWRGRLLRKSALTRPLKEKRRR